MDARVTPVKQKFLPALAEQLALWFPELKGRALAVSEVSVTKDNVPTLPLAMTAFIRSTGDPPSHSNYDTFEIIDTFIIDFWLEPARYKKANGTETPFWSYYDYEAIRDTLVGNLIRWETPGGERIAYRGMRVGAEPLAVTLTFTFMAKFNWCSTNTDFGEPFTIGFNLCAPESCCPDDICPDSVDPCDDIPTGPSSSLPPPIEEEDLEEAPSDGKMYVRQDGKWIELPVSQASASFNYRFDGQSTGQSDPGSGKLRYNSTVLANVTALYVDRLTTDGLDTTAMFTAMKFNDEIIIQETALALRNQVFRLTGPGVVMGGDWFEIPVEFVVSNGSPFNNNLYISVLTRSS
jgi:hypothetical protein